MGSSVSRLPSASQVPIPAIITMAQAFVGKFKLASQENFDEYMKAIGVGMAKRALARAATPVVTYELNGNEITITTTSMKDYVSKYTIGVEAEEETLDGRKTMVSSPSLSSLFARIRQCSAAPHLPKFNSILCTISWGVLIDALLPPSPVSL